MLFNSFQFAIFFVIVYSLYLVLPHKWQNLMLLTASCIFYGVWGWQFLLLMFVSITADYFCAIKMHESNARGVRRRFLLISLFVNLFILGFFKYFNFFSNNFEWLLTHLGFPIHPTVLKIVLPVGISFYTFQAMSYAVDVYRGELTPTKRFMDYALFVTFFPQLVAGPIMRTKDLMPQIHATRKLSLDGFYQGCYLIFWGLFQKIYIADNLAKIVNPVFASSGPYVGPTVLIALYAFAFQIYCDFSGYSNIARGLGKCMGFEIMINFNLPYFATNPMEFWKRWHISLSTWLRDYLYIPLGGNRKGQLNTYRNIAVTMLLGGLWHGASWTFIIWGAYQGLLLILYKISQPILMKILIPKHAVIDKIWFVVRVVFFFHLTCVGWLIFRAESISQILRMFESLVGNFKIVSGIGISSYFINFVCLTWILIVIQYFQLIKKDHMIIYKSNIFPKTVIYLIFFYSMVIYGTAGKEFIYFQF